MQLFYHPDASLGLVELSDEEARHCVKVLRKRVGDHLQLVDGKGNWYQGTIDGIQGKNVTVTTQFTKGEVARGYHMHLAMAPTKNMSRFEWFLEKATELGVDEITPLHCEHSERKQINLDRCEKILLSAMKQSMKATLPRLNNLTAFTTFIAKAKAPSENTQYCLAHCLTKAEDHIQRQYQKGYDVVIMIGPEGDFSHTEIEQSMAQGWLPISLGPERLRTETAGVVACNVIHFMNYTK